MAMAFDQSTRNRLQRFVSDARALLTQEFTRQVQHEYGMDPATGEVADLDKLSHMNDTRRETASLLRDTLNHYRATSPSGGTKETLERIVREQAFTVLNRLAALRMMEARGLLIESVARGYQSKGFQLYQRLAGSALGETGDAYRCYVFSLFDEFALDLAVLFDRFSPQGRLFPREAALLGLLDLINHSEIEPLWAEDETIGWIYQYYNSQEERRQMRADSPAPRNSRELAVRNQFFTPRYVVEFLADNTLGRLWYEMTQGQTGLTDQCRYLVRRPNESFMQSGEEAPTQEEPQEERSQEELLQQPVYIPFRALKDPRNITLLDPACGSMHFGLYAFNLYEKMYDETWELESQIGAESFIHSQGLKSFRETYATKEDFLRDVPRLIIEHNIHGIDIDPRAAQIAGLSLWLRAQRSWLDQGIKPHERPQIQRSNIVCAEPMPGEQKLLQEFTAGIRPRLLGQLVELIFEKMHLAGEVGSLLKIQELIQGAVEQAREEFNRELLRRKETEGYLIPEVAPEREPTLFDFADLPDCTRFWDRAEQEILEALKAYAEHAEGTEATQKRLFAHDAAKGFAFIDLCRKRFDVVLMNPPFGDVSRPSRTYVHAVYPDSSNDIYCAFIDYAQCTLIDSGLIGVITPRSCFFLSQMSRFRHTLLLGRARLSICVDLGEGVLDEAMNEVSCYIVPKQSNTSALAVFIRCVASDMKRDQLQRSISSIISGSLITSTYIRQLDKFRMLSDSPFAYWVSPNILGKLAECHPFEPEYGFVRQGIATTDDFKFVRLVSEVPAKAILTPPNIQFSSSRSSIDLQQRIIDHSSVGGIWAFHVKSGTSQPWYSPLLCVVDWEHNGKSIKSQRIGRNQHAAPSEQYYFLPGFSWTRRAVRLIPYVVPRGAIPSASRYEAFPSDDADLASIAITASNVSSAFARCYGEKFVWPNFLVENVRSLPFPKDQGILPSAISEVVAKKMKTRQDAYRNFEPFQEFTIPSLIHQFAQKEAFEFNPSCLLPDDYEKLVGQSLGLSDLELNELYQDLEEALAYQARVSGKEDGSGETGDQEAFLDHSSRSLQESLLSYVIGVVVGRWDVRFALDISLAPSLGLAFAPLPACPPGMLVGIDGLPASSAGIVSEEWLRARGDCLSIPQIEEVKSPTITDLDYPIVLNWKGILVDDSNHQDDIICRVREVLELIWQDQGETIEKETCEILGVRTLLSYFRQSNNFFADHLKRYTQNGRKAPIYWPLQTPSGSYALWLYYHRLTDQTLYTCVNDCVEPKLRQVAEPLNALRAKNNRSRQEDKELEQLLDFEQELKDFRDELLRVAKFWKPNLNDGVQITAAPLWKLFQHKPWQKMLKDTWDKLEKGDYDWAHLAYSIWPDRVRDKCRHDKSLAIAHGLEDLYEAPPDQPKKKRGRTRE
jgi:hypothetical protein